MGTRTASGLFPWVATVGTVHSVSGATGHARRPAVTDGDRPFVHRPSTPCARLHVRAVDADIRTDMDDHASHPCRTREEGCPPSRTGEVMPDDKSARYGFGRRRGERPGRITNQDALRAYHLNRVTSKFKMVISAEKAELLAGLLDSDCDDQQDVA